MVLDRKLWRKGIKGPYTAQAEVAPAYGKEPKVEVSSTTSICTAPLTVHFSILVVSSDDANSVDS